MTTITPTAKKLLAEGYDVKLERWGGPASGKTRYALEVETKLKADGYHTIIEDEIDATKNSSGVRVWAKKVRS